jgi:hypothetical protein
MVGVVREDQLDAGDQLSEVLWSDRLDCESGATSNDLGVNVFLLWRR